MLASEPPVYIVDDDAPVRRALERLMLSHGRTADGFEAAPAFLDALPRLSPGVVLTDVRMPEISGVELLTRLRGKGLHWPVVVMTGHADVPLAVQAMKAGAADFLEKPFSETSLLEAISTAASRLAAEVPAVTVINTLSPRQRDVLRRLVAGASSKMIARDLGIGHRTVETYRAQLMQKCGVRTLAALVQLGSAGLAAGAL